MYPSLGSGIFNRSITPLQFQGGTGVSQAGDKKDTPASTVKPAEPKKDVPPEQTEAAKKEERSKKAAEQQQLYTTLPLEDVSQYASGFQGYDQLQKHKLDIVEASWSTDQSRMNFLNVQMRKFLSESWYVEAASRVIDTGFSEPRQIYGDIYNIKFGYDSRKLEKDSAGNKVFSNKGWVNFGLSFASGDPWDNDYKMQGIMTDTLLGISMPRYFIKNSDIDPNVFKTIQDHEFIDVFGKYSRFKPKVANMSNKEFEAMVNSVNFGQNQRNESISLKKEWAKSTAPNTPYGLVSVQGATGDINTDKWILQGGAYFMMMHPFDPDLSGNGYGFNVGLGKRMGDKSAVFLNYYWKMHEQPIFNTAGTKLPNSQGYADIIEGKWSNIQNYFAPSLSKYFALDLTAGASRLRKSHGPTDGIDKTTEDDTNAYEYFSQAVFSILPNATEYTPNGLLVKANYAQGEGKSESGQKDAVQDKLDGSWTYKGYEIDKKINRWEIAAELPVKISHIPLLNVSPKNLFFKPQVKFGGQNVYEVDRNSGADNSYSTQYWQVMIGFEWRF